MSRSRAPRPHAPEETAGAGTVQPEEGDGAVDVFPASFAQRRLWLVDRLEPESPVYNIPAAFRLSGALDLEALEEALHEIEWRQESLRTRFGSRDGEPVQIIEPAPRRPLPVVDLSRLGRRGRDGELQSLVRGAARRPFDLTRAPLYRARLVRLAPEEHVLALTLHHIVADGWSMGVLYRELEALYGAFLDGAEPTLPEPPVQYADYAVWQREHLEDEALAAHLSYWRERLRDAPPVLELPADHRRPPVPTRRGAVHEIELSEETTERLRTLGRDEGATPFTVLLAAFSLWLGRHTARRDLVVGTPVAGRRRPELEGLIGFFVNNLVLRTDLSGDPGFRGLLRRVRDATFEDFAHQDLPFDRLVEELRPERSLSHTPLFQVVFAFQEDGASDLGLRGLDAVPLEVDNGTTKQDLQLFVVDSASRFRGLLQYGVELFDRVTVERMGRRLQTLLDGVGESPDAPLSALPLLPAEEARQILEVWSGTPAASPAGRTVPELFAARVERSPEDPAIVAGDEVISFAVLDRRARRLARRLAGRGVGPEVRVGLLLPRGPEILESVLAVLSAGGAYVPLDPAYPTERLVGMMRDAGLRVVVTLERLEELAGRSGTEVLVLDRRGGGNEEDGAERLPSAPLARSLAYAVYTSGSTGGPKGVMVTHADLGTRALDMARRFGLEPGDRQLQFVSPSFDVFAEEVFAAWAGGAAVVTLPDAPAIPPAEVLRLCARAGVTKVNLPASYWHYLVDEIVEAGLELPASLRIQVVGAEAPSAEKLGRWWPLTPPTLRTFNAYGPTEATIMTTLHEIPEPPDPERGFQRIPIGGPLPGTTCHVLDADLRPAPVGVPGELCIGGRGVGRGYLGRPALTASAFVPDPFAPAGDEGGGRLYRTGDRVRWLPSGVLEFLGRLDDQVKLRGFRVELDEITAAIEEHPEVSRAAVTVSKQEGAPERLLGYFVPAGAGGGAVGAERERALRDFLAERLPDYMVPSRLRALDELPLTPNGKIDHARLPVPEPAADPESSFTAPRTADERLLAEIWCEVLGVERVGVDDDFFALGGNSLALLRVHSKLDLARPDRVSVVELFRHSTVEAMARCLASGEGDGVSLQPGRDRASARRAARGRRRAKRRR